MQLKLVDPFEVVISTLNERKTHPTVKNPSRGSLKNSVANIGIVQPPVVRVLPDGKYEAIIGQRRTLAAQEVGLKEIPVMVVDWDDDTSLAASITENVSEFRENVSARDRAEATLRLFELKDMDPNEPKHIHDVAKFIGVHPRTIQNWLECGRDEWKGTPLHVDSADVEDLSRLSLDKVQTARRVTGGGDKGLEFLREVRDRDLSSHEVRELGRMIQTGYKMEDAFDEVNAKREKVSTHRLVLQLDSELRADLEEKSKTMGAPVEDTALFAIEQFLYGE